MSNIIKNVGTDEIASVVEFERFPDNSDMVTSRDERPSLHRLMDYCCADSGVSMRWERPVTFKCTCSTDKIWSVLRMLSRHELVETVRENPDTVQVHNFL